MSAEADAAEPELGAVTGFEVDPSGLERLASLAVDNAPIGIALVAVDGSWLRVNQELCRILGYEASQLARLSFQDITHPDDLDADLALLRATLAGERTGYRMEKRYLRADGSILWAQLDVVLVRSGDEPLYFISQIQDVGPRKEAEARLSHLALHDSLTGLPNRMLFRDRLEQALERRRRGGGTIAIGFLDLDDFKLVNDTRGHSVGDQLLVRAARRLERALRAGDTLARFGGDEFVVMFDEVSDEATATDLGNRLLASLDAPFDIGGERFQVSASIGLVMAHPDVGIDDILRHADLAMYEAKRLGKHRLAVYDTGLESSVLDRVDIEQRLRFGLEHGELFPAYQPVVDLVTGAIIGFEVLARWDRPGTGVIPAASFIAVANAAGLVPRLTEVLLAQVEVDLERLGVTQGRHLLLNVTPDVLSAAFMDQRLAHLADLTGHHERLVIEMTEANLLQLDGSAASVLRALRDDGVRFSVDDFGTGYSALSMLATLEPDVIKVDRSFVQALDQPYPHAIVAALCTITDELGVKTIGEGVERQSEADALRSLGCQAAQGYLFARPARIDELQLPPV